jgi:hypothetical protein
MDFRTSLALGAGFLAIALFAGWRGARPPNPHKGPRMVPWRFVMALAAAGALITLFQAAQVAGLGPPGPR